MAKIKFAVAALALLTTFIEVSFASNAVFTIIGLKSIRPNKDYRFSVSTNKLKRSLYVNISFTGTTDTGTPVGYYWDEQKIYSESLKTFKLKAGNLKPGSYKLNAVAYDPYKKVYHKVSKKILYRPKIFSVFMHTDRAIYKGGDVVKFRLFAIDSETKPFDLNDFSLKITDPNDENRHPRPKKKKRGQVEDLNDLSLKITDPNDENRNPRPKKKKRGQLEGSYQLSEDSAPGVWKIEFDGDGESYEKTFEVREYVLPSFSVDVDVPERVGISDVTIPVRISAQYAFDKTVLEGKAVVKFSEFEFSTLAYTKTIHERTVEVESGSAVFSVDIMNDLKPTVNHGMHHPIEVHATFTDAATQQTITGTSLLIIRQFTYDVVFIGNEHYEEGKIYSCKLSFVKFDRTSAPAGIPISVKVTHDDICEPDEVTGTRNCTETSYFEEYTTDLTGSITVEIDPMTYDFFTIQSSSEFSFKSFDLVSRPAPAVIGLLDVALLTPKPKFNSRIDIQVKTSTNVKTLHCHMMAKGVMVKSITTSFELQTAEISFTPTFDYVPYLKLIFFYYDDNGMIVAKTLLIEFNDALPNYLNLESSSDTVEPETDLSLKVCSHIDSTVLLLAIDQRALQLKTGNTFTVDDVVWDFYSKYGAVEQDNPRIPPSTTLISRDDYDYFESSNLFVLITVVSSTKSSTFAASEIYMEPPPVQNKRRKREIQVSETPTLVAPRVRRNFAESFLWQDVEIRDRCKHGCANDSDSLDWRRKGQAIFKFEAPDSITSYVISGVSMSYDYGMGLPSIKPSLKVFSPFFIQCILPHHVKRNEVLEQPIVLFNYIDKNQDVLVSVKKNDKKVEFLNPENDGWTVETDRVWQKITSIANEPTSLRLVMRPKVLGHVDVSITAVGPLAGDSIFRPLKVE